MIKFGTGGWRAVIGDDFNKENVCRIAQAICDLIKETGSTLPVAVGYDRRFLSSDAAKWIAEVFSANGVKSLFMKRSAPTPLIMFNVKDQGLDYGVEVTASHNPYSYNGIKLIIKEGRDAPQELTAHLEELAEKATVKSEPFALAEKKGNVIYVKGPFNAFIDSVLSRLDVEKIKNADLRVLFDSMHGSATYPMMTVLCSARVTLDMMNSNKDGYFGGRNPAPGVAESAELRLRVKTEGYDLGIQVDGDGDRLAVIDGDGNYIEPNKILVMLYYYLHEYRGWKGGVVRNNSTTHMLDRVAESLGETCYEVPVGFKYISKALDDNDAVLGGESSGGLTVRGHIFGKDSVYAAGLFVEMVAGIGKPIKEYLSELEEKFGKFEMVQENLKFDPAKRQAISDRISDESRLPNFGKTPKEIRKKDGVKFVFDDDSFVICRFSGTEPLLRIFAEAHDEDTAKGYINAVKSAVLF